MAFFHLLMNKDLISKIREETIEVLGDDGVDDQQSVTYENYKQFLWAQAVVLEALRLHPGVPKNVKLAVNADKIPDGPTIEAGDIVRDGKWQEILRYGETTAGIQTTAVARECSEKRIDRSVASRYRTPTYVLNIATDGESHDDFSETPSTRLR
ncbi:hypothetical protein H4Q26_015319 [Puccinia striiformis f. sp. tritici PST-130]|nr:hypothetical protein H4Q26_015319 [Puccinia striiformis f. sp. tritici PST-130]